MLIDKLEDLIENSEIIIRPQAMYLITGGLGDLGLVTAHWLVTEKGVRHLVLAGRNKATIGAQQQIDQLTALGASVLTFTVDMTDSEQVNDMIASIGQQGDLAGVIHAAGSMDDGVLSLKLKCSGRAPMLIFGSCVGAKRSRTRLSMQICA